MSIDLTALFPGPVGIIMAHGDDETLGCGGLIAALREQHLSSVHVLLATVGTPQRSGDVATSDTERRHRRLAHTQQALSILGCPADALSFVTGANVNMGYAACTLDQVPALALNQHVAEWLREIQPRTVLTHWSHDVHDDHRRVAHAVNVATRLMPGQSVVRLYECETLSSTEYVIDHAFAPNTWLPLSAAQAQKKAHAVSCYVDETHPAPHPRSVRGVLTHAAYRGQQSGTPYAEAYRLVRATIHNS